MINLFNKYVVDKEEIICFTLEKELKVRIWSFNAVIFVLRYQGDGEKIFPNQPLIVFINLISLK